ncbi:MAG: alpha-galactosidase [Spirochaetes bacterium]|nr:alpha-galactosidase [Spirochaetota bacterium]
MIQSDFIEVTEVEGSLASGKCLLKFTPKTEHLRFVASGRGMGNLRATIPFGESGSSYTFLGLASDLGGLLLSTPVPLPEYARFTISGDTVRVESPVAVKAEASKEGLAALLLAYGERHKSPSIPAPVFGWNSWDNFNASVTEADILANMDAIEKRPWLKEKLTHIIIDDGWQTNWGEWTVNGKFPRGMDWLAKEIRRRGFTPGLWLAPLMVEPATPLYQRHSECLLKDTKGHPYLVNLGHTRTFYALDLSVKKSEAFLRETFKRVADWGYEYLKLDFLYNQAECLENGDGFAAEKSWSTNEHVRRLLALVREVCGPKTFVVACNPLYELGGKDIQEARLTNDIASFWENAMLCLNAHAARFFMARRWLLADPDFTVVRVPGATWDAGPHPFHCEVAWNRNQENKGWRRGKFWTESEMKVAFVLDLLSGGSIILGDHLPQLNAQGDAYLKLALKYGGGEPAAPLDLDGRRSLPCIWKNDRLVAFLNPYETHLKLSVPAGVRLGKEIFTGEEGVASAVPLAPHSTRVYELA